MLALISGSRLEVIPGAGHFSYADHFAEFSRILIPFLKGQAA
jgi:pimeloyl-ACP methyl ester carboxylesterase